MWEWDERAGLVVQREERGEEAIVGQEQRTTVTYHKIDNGTGHAESGEQFR